MKISLALLGSCDRNYGVMSDYGFNFDTTYTQLPEPFYTMNAPVKVASPEVVVRNGALSQEMGLDFASATDEQLAQLFAGNVLPDGASPFSQAYAGHQFGHFTMLGDGRAHMMGEHVTSEGVRYDLQYKGAGRTPYSRRGDGRAALGPMLREYIISEALHALGIPATRSLAVVKTGQPVMREHALQGAVLTRVASSHIRVGTFEYAADPQNTKPLEALVDYTVDRHYPALIGAENKAVALLEAVMERQINLVVHRMRVGFVHGVLNTDNVTLSGEAIDFGPCAFIDRYDPRKVFSSIDQNGRYAFGNQAQVTHWNLARLTEALLSVINSDQELAIKQGESVLQRFPEIYQEKWLSMMGAKLGLQEVQEGDDDLITDLLQWMYDTRADYTQTFHALSQREFIQGECQNSAEFKAWYQRWLDRLQGVSHEESLELMRQSNPVIIPRNHRVEEALAAAEAGDLTVLHQLLNALQTPYVDDESKVAYQEAPESGEEAYRTFCGT